ncbi:MAG TPA: hypothetical protein P5280_12185 [Cyclobacteriaceae bacterium]|nr:hypothetical protein [Cyclobacteriaceae bacterium]
MNGFLNISEEHIGGSASPADAKRVVELLQADGWKVVYGDAPWQFTEESQRQSFEAAFQWALKVMRNETSEGDRTTLRDLAEQRFRQNGRLQPFATELMQERPWPEYWRWLINSPTDVIISWVKTEMKKDAPGK